MNFNKKVKKEQKKCNDTLESRNSTDAKFPNNDYFERDISSNNDIQNILNMYTKEIQKERNREISNISFKRSESLLRGIEDNSDNIYISSINNLSSVIPSEYDENVKIEYLQDRNDSLLEKDSNISYDDSLNKKIEKKLTNWVNDNKEHIVKMNLENYTDSRNESQEINEHVEYYPNEKEESQQYIVYSTYDSENNSNTYPMNLDNEYNRNYSKNEEYEPKKEQKEEILQDYKICDSNNYRNLSYSIYPKERHIYENNSNIKENYIYNNYEESFNDIPIKHKISEDIISEYSIDPIYQTRKFVSEDLAFPLNSGKYRNGDYESINIFNVEHENEVPLDYSSVTYESSNINTINSNAMYNNNHNNSSSMKNKNSYNKIHNSKYQNFVEFMKNKSYENPLQLNNKNNEEIEKENELNKAFETKIALSLNNKFVRDAIHEKNKKTLLKSYSGVNVMNVRKYSSTNETTRKPKTYSLEDMKNGKVKIPDNIFVPLSFNVPGNNIIDSYERNKKLETFMQDCNNSTNLILKYQQHEQKKQPIKTLNIPINMAYTVNDNIGVPIIYEDDFDRNEYHPNVKNLHVGSIFEKHVFNMLKNKKDLGKKIYSESTKFKKFNYEQENGFWISNISKDRIVNPEKNDSYITELVYEKDKSPQEEINMLKQCKNYKDVIPSINEFYKNNNFYNFLVKENLYPHRVNPEIATIMRRYDVDNISVNKIISEIPGIVPYVNDTNE